MDKQDSRDTGRLIGAALAGLAIGVGIGMLFAPEKGADMRKKIFGNLADLFDDVSEQPGEKNKTNEDPEKDRPV